MEFSEFETRARSTDIMGPGLTQPLIGLAGEAGSLLAEFKKHVRDRTSDRDLHETLRDELGDTLWYCAAIAHRAGLTLEEIVRANLIKTQGRFNRPEVPPPISRLDGGLPAAEQLPDTITVTFSQEVVYIKDEENLVRKVVMTAPDGQQLGHSLDDNSLVDDEYRFHDAFHLANMVFLGWSPVMRSLLGRKRKSSSVVDRTEDGARSIAIEEGLAALIFAAAGNSRFRTARRVPWDLLKTCMRATSHLEVSVRTPADWEFAILYGFRVFNRLTEIGGGTVEANLRQRTLLVMED